MEGGGNGNEESLESWEEERGQGTVPITLTCQASALGICNVGGDKPDAPSSIHTYRAHSGSLL